MNKSTFLFMLISTVLMNLHGCGFGGFSDSNNGTESKVLDSTTDTKISGVVSKGLFTSGTVQFYGVDFDGSQTLLKTTAIRAFGNYSARLNSQKTTSNGSYTGVVLIKATGSYLDEATGIAMTIDDKNPLRAIIANPSGMVNVSVTPLTELATRKALAAKQTGGQVTATDVMNANAMLADMFKVDIIATIPVEPDLSSSGFGRASTTQSQKDYTLALAALSQMAKNGALANTLNILAQDILDGAMTMDNAEGFQAALTTFLDSDKNATGVKSIASTNLVNAGGTVKTLKIATVEKQGAGNIIGGITVAVKLPPGVTVKADWSVPDKPVLEPLSGVVKGSGVISAGAYVRASYVPSPGGVVTITLASPTGFTAGEFATITCDVDAGASLDSSAFSIYKNLSDSSDPKNFRAVDRNGAAFIDGVITVELLPN